VLETELLSIPSTRTKLHVCNTLISVEKPHSCFKLGNLCSEQELLYFVFVILNIVRDKERR
jgi:hypothetical protein